MKHKLIVISSHSKLSSLYLREFWEFRDVFFMLILRDIKLRYRQTALGVLWVVLQPLSISFLFSVVFGKIGKFSSEGMPYILFAFCGLIPWMFFSGGMQRASNSLLADEKLITKVYFPRMFIPLASCFGVLIDFFVSFVFMFFLMFCYDQPIHSQIFFLPVMILITILLTSGLSLFFSAVNVYYRDFKHILPFLIQFWMYASPIIYSINMMPEKWKWLYSLNPLVGLIEGYRWTLIANIPFPTFSFFVSLGLTLIICTIGTAVFRKVENHFADII